MLAFFCVFCTIYTTAEQNKMKDSICIHVCQQLDQLLKYLFAKIILYQLLEVCEFTFKLKEHGGWENN